MNMKKIYITPSINVMDIETEVLLAGSNGENLILEVNQDEPQIPESAMSKEHNGIWD